MIEKSITEIINESSQLFKAEDNLIVLDSSKQIVIVGDTHGDYESTEKILKKFGEDYTLVFLGDYVDRALKPLGSLKNIKLLLEEKIRRPDDIIMLRGNHEFYRIFDRYGFGDELLEYNIDLIGEFENLFSDMPYVAETENGLLALHGGIPYFSSVDELKSLPKGIKEYKDMKLISQIVWNDNVDSADDIRNKEGITESDRGLFSSDLLFKYGEPFFSEKMTLLDKSVLVRGHDYLNKGYSLNNRILTIFTSELYYNSGKLKGNYVAVLDPQKKLSSALELKIIQIEDI